MRNQIELLTEIALKSALQDNYADERKNLITLFKKITEDKTELFKLESYQNLSQALGLMMNHEIFLKNDTYRTLLSLYSFFCTTKALEENPKNETIRVLRLMILEALYDDFYPYMAEAIGTKQPPSPILPGRTPVRIQMNDYKYDIAKNELSKIQNVDLDDYPMLEGLRSNANIEYNNDYDPEESIDKIIDFITIQLHDS